MEKEIAEIAKALDTIAMNLKSLAKKAGKSLMPAKPEKPAKVAKGVKAKPVSKPVKKSAKASAAPKSATGKRASAKAAPTISDQVLKFVQRVRKGISIEAIQEKASLTQQQVNNALSKLLKAGSISRIGRGVYSAAGGKEKPKATAKPKAAKAKAKPVAEPKAAKVTKKAPRKPKAPKSEPVVEQAPVVQEPAGQDLPADEVQPQETPVSEAGE